MSDIDASALEMFLDDPTLFAESFHGFPEYTDKFGHLQAGPYSYQETFWNALVPHDPRMCVPQYTDTCDGSPHKRMVLLWGRQSGKTTSVADAVLWYSFTHPGTVLTPTQTLITSVGINTSM